MAKRGRRDTTPDDTRRSLHSDPLAFVLRPIPITPPPPITPQVHHRATIPAPSPDVTPNTPSKNRRPHRFSDPTVRMAEVRSLKQAVDICSRREARKQVLHASGAAGGRVKPPKFSWRSKTKC